MRKSFVVVGAAVVLAGSALVGVVQAQDARGGGPNGGNGLPGLLGAFDTNKDGAVTQAEINAARGGNLTKFDKNADGKLSVEEYGALWLDAMRTDMVRQFQGHDTDGDGVVTGDEFNARFKDTVARADTNKDGKVDATDMVRPPVAQVPPQQRGEAPQQRRGDAPAPQRQVPQQQQRGPQGRGAAMTAPAAIDVAPTRAI